MENVGKLYGHLENFTFIWCILWLYDNVVVIGIIFPRFGIVFKTIWQPCCVLSCVCNFFSTLGFLCHQKKVLLRKIFAAENFGDGGMQRFDRLQEGCAHKNVGGGGGRRRRQPPFLGGSPRPPSRVLPKILSPFPSLSLSPGFRLLDAARDH
jgi:hypothetical protein